MFSTELLLWKNNLVITYFVTFCKHVQLTHTCQRNLCREAWKTPSNFFFSFFSMMPALIGLVYVHTFTVVLSMCPHLWQRACNVSVFTLQEPAGISTFLIKGPSVPIPLMNSLIHTFIKSPGVCLSLIKSLVFVHFGWLRLKRPSVPTPLIRCPVHSSLLNDLLCATLGL